MLCLWALGCDRVLVLGDFAAEREASDCRDPLQLTEHLAPVWTTLSSFIHDLFCTRNHLFYPFLPHPPLSQGHNGASLFIPPRPVLRTTLSPSGFFFFFFWLKGLFLHRFLEVFLRNSVVFQWDLGDSWVNRGEHLWFWVIRSKKRTDRNIWEWSSSNKGHKEPSSRQKTGHFWQTAAESYLKPDSFSTP